MIHYPVNDFDPLMKGMVIGGLGIFHVFLAQFAIGGGMLMCYFQWLAQTGRSPHARLFLDSYFRVLILLSFVLGALTGVAMWFTSIQVSAPTIGLMIDEFHWLWAVEWTFFCLEVVAGYAFYRYAHQLNDRTRMSLLVLYTTGAWMSLFWINGILSFQLTPGSWMPREGGLLNVWRGFFNPSFFPSLLFRTVTCMTVAALAACVVINTIKGLDRETRRALINRCAHFLAPMVLMPVLGLWFLLVMPADSRAWVLGGSPVMTMFLNITVGASVLIGGYALVGMLFQRLYINGATATLLLALAFGASAGGEFVREGVRKPYTVRNALYSNALLPEQIAELRRTGLTTVDPYPLRHSEQYPNDQLRLGAMVYRNQCSVCHTIEGVNGLTHLAGPWLPDQRRMNLAKLQHTKPFMPPFAGTPEELEALVQMIGWATMGRPTTWPESKNPQVLEQIRTWLQEAGTKPGDLRQALLDQTSRTASR